MEATPRTSAEPDDIFTDQSATEKPGTGATRGGSFEKVRLSRREWLQEVHKGRSAMTKVKWEAGYTIRLLHCSVHIRFHSRRGTCWILNLERHPSAGNFKPLS